MFFRSPSGKPASSKAAARLLNGRRFSGERGLVNREVDGFGDPGVSRDSVTGAQQHDVSGDQVARRDSRFLAIAQHVRGRRGHSAQRFQRPSGAVFLDEPEQHGKQHDDGDDDGLERMTEEAGDDRGAEQNQDQRVLELREERPPGRLRGQRLQLVGAMDVESMCGLGARQSRRASYAVAQSPRPPTACARLAPVRALLDAVLRGHSILQAPLLEFDTDRR